MHSPTRNKTPETMDLDDSEGRSAGSQHTPVADGDVDDHGIPRSIRHVNQNAFTAVWSFIHKLAETIADPLQPGHPFTHICLACCENYKSPDPTSTAWKAYLMRQQNSSNAKKHMLAAHKNHPFFIEVTEAKVVKISDRIALYNSGTSHTSESQSKPKKHRTLHEAITIGADELRIHTVLDNDELLVLLRRLSNQSKLAAPARDTFYSFAEGEFNHFIEWVSRTLHAEFATVLQEPFVAVLHDLWTNAANVNVIGVTVMFIDSKWRLIKLSLLTLPNPRGHAATTVADLIKTGFQSRYNIDIDKFARFTVSDTTGCARNVSDHFSATDQVDCLMHLLSLCLLYALGLKENTRNDDALVVTPGGEFREGLRVIQKLRDLAAFFNTPGRLQKLKQIKDMYNLPAVNIEVDSKTRIGYAVTLMRRSVYNHYAFTQYFESSPLNEQTIWSNISTSDWQLITEMEGLTDQLAQFSLGEVQKEGVSSSYALLFRKMISLSVDSGNVNCLVLERPNPTENQFSQRREVRSVRTFSWGGNRCRDRLRGQLAFRFPVEDINEVKALLLDPRIKAKAVTIVSEAAILARAERELQFEHENVYQKLFSRKVVSEESKDTVPEPVRTVLPASYAINTAINALLEVEIPPERSECHDVHSDLLVRAQNDWNQWKNLRVKWSSATATWGGGTYNALELYREVDVLEWFRDQGERDFPGIAVLARIYLGKPLSTAAQERFFSLSGYVVNELRTRLDDDRAEMMCLLEAHWPEYKESMKKHEQDLQA